MWETTLSQIDSTAHKRNWAENIGGGGKRWYKMALVIKNFNLRRIQVRKREKISLNQPLTI